MSAELIVTLVIGVFTILLMWQQNRILQRQNEIFARQQGADMSAPPINKYRKYWPMLAMGVVMLFTWLAVGYDLYDRHQVPNWDNYPFKVISGGTYVDETVVLDGYEFNGTTFDNVTFDYEGKAPAKLIDVHIVKDPSKHGKVFVGLGSHNPVVKQTISVAEMMNRAAGCETTTVQHP